MPSDPATFWRSPAGLPYHITADGTKVPALVSGGSGDVELPGSADATTTPPPPPPPPAQPDGKVMTQEQIDGMMGRATKKAASEARQALFEELGGDVSTVKQALEEAEALKEASLSNEQKLARKNAELEAIVAKERADKAEIQSQSLIKVALAPHMTAAAIARIAPTVHVPADATPEDVEDIVEALREEVPGLFATPGTPTPPTPGTTSQNRRPRTTTQSTQQSSHEWVTGWLGDNETGGELPLL